MAAEQEADPSGAQLVHCDLWLQNWCRAPRGVVLVDWDASARGNVALCRAWGEAAVRTAGGPGGVVLAAGNGAWAAWMAAQAVSDMVNCWNRPLPPRLLETQRREAFASLCWACDELGLPPPEPVGGFLPPGPWRP